MKSESGENWKKWGKSDPYFGVLSEDKYRMDKISDEGLAEFFQTGEDFVNETRARVKRLFDKDIGEASVLDFGCGVGRLTLPFARLSKESVCGIDISPDIIQRANDHQKTSGLSNLSFESFDGQDLDPKRKFEFINSYIVFQHIEPVKGMKLLKKLLLTLEEGGILQVQITHGHRLPLPTYLNFYLRTKLMPYNLLYSMIKHRRFYAEPTMQMNHYEPRKLFDLFSGYSDEVHVEFTDHGGHLGAFYLLRKASKKPFQPVWNNG